VDGIEGYVEMVKASDLNCFWFVECLRNFPLDILINFLGALLVVPWNLKLP